LEQYLQTVPRCRRDGGLLPVGQLLQSADFPDAAGITAFYVESVSLVDMLVETYGAKTFALYLQNARRYGCEKALDRTYKIHSFAELQSAWERRAFAAGAE
jgi:hypothetical protein